MKYRGLFFDLFGTLLIYGDMSAAWSDWLSAFHGSLKDFGYFVPRRSLSEQCNGFFGKPKPSRITDQLTVFEHRIQTVCATFGLRPTNEELAMTASNCIRAWQSYITLDPLTKPVLQRLKMEHRLALISNFEHPPHVQSVLSDYGLLGLFEVVIISGNVGVEKPDERIFFLALNQTGLHPAEAAYIGDTIEDVVGARAAGLQPIMIRRNTEFAKAAQLDYRALSDATCPNQDRDDCEIDAVELQNAYIIQSLDELLSFSMLNDL